jgi:Anaerobic dehydrogenases, typically selenocysteine-containing
VRRRRQCHKCDTRFTTYERIDELPVYVMKRSGDKEPFDRLKIVAGLGSATKGRPISAQDLDDLATTVEDAMRLTGGDVTSAQVGQAVLERLRKLDEVAYLRFASVYKGFDEASDFQREITLLESARLPSRARKSKVKTNMPQADRIVVRTCPLCEAGCGLEISVRDTTVVRIRGDMNDVFSKGYICPKGSTLKQLHEDPDRLRQPLVKRDGQHVEVSWEQAWEHVERGFTRVIADHGRESIGAYLGNPGAHNLSAMTFNRVLLTAIGSRQRFSASSVDQVPKQVSAGFMFGTAISVPVPDLDRCDYLLMLGANPYASNGSLATAPDWPGRLEAIRARGGRLIVVDPRRSRTAESADEWLAIRPGTDALLLAAMVTAVFQAQRAHLGDHLAGHVNGLAEVQQALADFTPEAVARVVGIDAVTIRRIAVELCDAERAAVYGRIGTTTVSFGTTASWLVDVLNA